MISSTDLANSALVVAHPDDEILWFSSIVGSVGRVIIAYEACADLPGLEQSRRAASEAFPLTSARFLRLPEPCSLNHVDWNDPRMTDFGMALNDADAERRYVRSYEVLRAELSTLLAGASHVFTHNPWGEYGHPDHVQLSRLVTALGGELGFRACYSSYVAPRSMRLAARFLPTLKNEGALPTDRALAERIKALYVAHGAWTWHASYEAPKTEAFFTRADATPTEADMLPLTCLMTT